MFTVCAGRGPRRGSECVLSDGLRGFTVCAVRWSGVGVKVCAVRRRGAGCTVCAVKRPGGSQCVLAERLGVGHCVYCQRD